MFAKIYRYKIRKNDFQKWKKNNDTVTKLYKKYGGGNSTRLVRKSSDFILIIELGFYKSKKDFLKITKQVNRNPKTDGMFQEFLSIVHNKKFSEEEFEVI